MKSALINLYKKILRRESKFKIIESPSEEGAGSGFPFDAVVSEPVDEEGLERLVSRELLQIVEEFGLPRSFEGHTAGAFDDPLTPPLTGAEVKRLTAIIAGALRRRREVMLGLGEVDERGRLERLLARFTVTINLWTRKNFR